MCMMNVDTDLSGEQDVFSCLRHGTVRGRDHQDGSVHLRAIDSKDKIRSQNKDDEDET